MTRAFILHIFSENRRMILLVAGLAVFFLILLYLAAGIGSQTGVLRAKYQQKQRAVIALGPLDAATVYRQGGEDIKTLMARIPASSDFPGVLGQLMELAASNRLLMGAILYKPVKSEIQGIVSYTLTSSVTGDYKSIKSFLARLNGLDGIAIVDSVVIANNDPFEVRASMDFDITIHLRGRAQ